MDNGFAVVITEHYRPLVQTLYDIMRNTIEINT